MENMGGHVCSPMPPCPPDLVPLKFGTIYIGPSPYAAGSTAFLESLIVDFMVEKEIDEVFAIGFDVNSPVSQAMKRLKPDHQKQIAYHTHLVYDGIDDENARDMRHVLRTVLPALVNALDARKKVYVHCEQGLSRSATVVLSLLMYREKMKFRQALRFLLEKRKCVIPNASFCRILQTQEEMQRLEVAVPDMFPEGKTVFMTKELTDRLNAKINAFLVAPIPDKHACQKDRSCLPDLIQTPSGKLFLGPSPISRNTGEGIDFESDIMARIIGHNLTTIFSIGHVRSPISDLRLIYTHPKWKCESFHPYYVDEICDRDNLRQVYLMIKNLVPKLIIAMDRGRGIYVHDNGDNCCSALLVASALIYKFHQKPSEVVAHIQSCRPCVKLGPVFMKILEKQYEMQVKSRDVHLLFDPLLVDDILKESDAT